MGPQSSLHSSSWYGLQSVNLAPNWLGLAPPDDRALSDLAHSFDLSWAYCSPPISFGRSPSHSAHARDAHLKNVARVACFWHTLI
jgi:hypothetical protein